MSDMVGCHGDQDDGVEGRECELTAFVIPAKQTQRHGHGWARHVQADAALAPTGTGQAAALLLSASQELELDKSLEAFEQDLLR